ncbi:hypothetical protein R1sor_019264 [Riccia sorocarpa]|uniref:SWIM-type domain-containing protein n=1 Tax=Riccia sorocarpa TaxID=122646 RepID=A0ABD3IER5_9MARC
MDLPAGKLTSANLQWGDGDVAYIPLSRMKDFVSGEGSSDPNFETNFFIRDSRRGSIEGSNASLLHLWRYYCAYGPEDEGEARNPSVALVPREKPKTGDGSRPRKKKVYNNHQKRGCQCHFMVRRWVHAPDVCEIKFIERRHVNKAGSPCHGDVSDASTVNWPEKFCIAPRISLEMRSILEDLIRFPEKVLHYVQHRASTAQSEFLLALQSPWQQRQMLRFSHNSVMAMDSTFATNAYGFPFFTLVVFDQHQMGLPVAWCIQASEGAHQIETFLLHVKNSALRRMPDWNPSTFITDCCDAEVRAIRTVFPSAKVIFCSWYVRRAWKTNLIKKVSDRRLVAEMNVELGRIMYARTMDEVISLWDAFKLTYDSEVRFLQYMEGEWMSRIDTWMSHLRTMRRENQNTNGAVEAWHQTYKKALARVVGALNARRCDRILEVLFQNILPYFWYNMRRKQRGRVINYKIEAVILSSVHAALEMDDSSIRFHTAPQSHMYATVQNCSDADRVYLVEDIYNNSPSCNCPWGVHGNMCKHQVKALLLVGHSPGLVVQMLGTNFGGQFAGMEQLRPSEILPDLNEAPETDDVDEQHRPFEPENSIGVGEDLQSQHDVDEQEMPFEPENSIGVEEDLQSQLDVDEQEMPLEPENSIAVEEDLQSQHDVDEQDMPFEPEDTIGAEEDLRSQDSNPDLNQQPPEQESEGEHQGVPTGDVEAENRNVRGRRPRSRKDEFLDLLR